MTRFFFLASLLLSLLSMGCSQNSTLFSSKSSKIPERREFPVNPKLNPCVDFYKYACSKAEESFQLRADRSRHIFAFSDSAERLLEHKKKYFTRLAKQKPRNEKETQLKSFYLGCMDKPANQKQEKEYVAKVIKELEAIKSRGQLQSKLAENIDNGKFAFLSFSTGLSNHKRPKYRDMTFWVGLRTLPERSYYRKKDVTKATLALMTDFFKTISMDRPAERAKWVLDFETQLANTAPTPPEVRKLFATKTKISRSKLKSYKALKVDQFLKKIPRHVHFRNIMKNKTFAFLNKKLSYLPLEKLKSIYAYHSLKSVLDDAYPEHFNKKFEFKHKFLGGPEKRSERQERCTKQVMSLFDREIDFILMPEMFPNFPKKKFVGFVERIREKLLSKLDSNTWLTKKAKREAKRKIKTMRLYLVSPDTEAQWDFNLPGKYSAKTPIDNWVTYQKLQIQKGLNELKGPIEVPPWGMGPLIVNAYYSPSKNLMAFPVGILQYPMYDPNASDIENYGGIGAVIGHELGHSIDDNGNRYDSKGKLRKWMTKKDQKKFSTLTKPLISQFEKIGHNGKFTLGENIGDLVGVTTAFETAFTYQQPTKEAMQKYFLQYARNWCGVMRPKQKELLLKTDPHSLIYARVNQQVQQQPKFAEAFSCKATDPMVLDEKDVVKIW